MKAEVGCRVFTVSTLLTNEKVMEFISEFRSRCMAYCFSRDNRLLYPKTKFVYVDVLANVVRHNLSKSGSVRRAVNVAPILPLRIRYVNGIRGNTAAPAILDLSKLELRIPFLNVRVKIKENLGRKIEQILSDKEAKPKFILQIHTTTDGIGREILKLNIVVQRYKKPLKSSKKLILAYDVNSRYGVTLVCVSIGEHNVKLILLKRYKPPNHYRRRRMAAILQQKGKDSEAGRVRRKERKLNREFIKRIIADTRKLGIRYRRKGYSVIILVDKPETVELKGTELSNTLNRLANALRNLCLFEGFKYIEMRASGKYCPICGEKYVRGIRINGKRIYICGNRHYFERDFSACWNLILKYIKDKREEIRRLLLKLGSRALGAPSWLPSPTGYGSRPHARGAGRVRVCGGTAMKRWG